MHPSDFRVPNQRADLGVSDGGITYIQVARCMGQCFCKRPCLSCRQKYALHRHAHLARVIETSFQDRLEGELSVCVLGKK